MAALTPEQTGKVFAHAAALAKLTDEQRDAMLAQWRPQAAAPAAPPAGTCGPTAAPQVPAQATPATLPRPRLAAPPGRLGVLVRHLRDASLYPCTEVAVCAALGMVAGLAGRAYTTPGRPTGLNVYLALVGRTGSGKEALHEGPAAVLAQVRRQVPSVASMVNFDDHASGPALVKAAAEGVRSSATFVAELGKVLERMANARDTNAQGLRNVLTKLYSKSGPHSVVGALRYSDAAKHVDIDGSVALSLVGESTPGVLLAALTQGMSEDGLLSRIQFIDMPAQRADYNAEAEAGAAVPAELLQGLVELATHALTLLHNGQTAQCVLGDAEAAEVLDDYRHECTQRMDAAGDSELLRAVHNRAHLKALKYAGLMAALDNPLRPVVTAAMAHWATGFASLGVRYVLERAQAGDLGTGDDARQRYVARLMHRWLQEPALAAKLGVPADLHAAHLVPRKYLQQRTSDVAAFNKHPTQGATQLLDHTLRSMCDSGYIAEADRAKVGEKYAFHGRCFRVFDLPLV